MGNQINHALETLDTGLNTFGRLKANICYDQLQEKRKSQWKAKAIRCQKDQYQRKFNKCAAKYT